MLLRKFGGGYRDSRCRTNVDLCHRFVQGRRREKPMFLLTVDAYALGPLVYRLHVRMRIAIAINLAAPASFADSGRIKTNHCISNHATDGLRPQNDI